MQGNQLIVLLPRDPLPEEWYSPGDSIITSVQFDFIWHHDKWPLLLVITILCTHLFSLVYLIINMPPRVTICGLVYKTFSNQ